MGDRLLADFLGSACAVINASYYYDNLPYLSLTDQ